MQKKKNNQASHYITCEACGKKVYASMNIIKTYGYYCMPCRKKLGMYTRTCEQCGVEFELSPYQVRVDYHLCKRCANRTTSGDLRADREPTVRIHGDLSSTIMKGFPHDAPGNLIFGDITPL